MWWEWKTPGGVGTDQVELLVAAFGAQRYAFRLADVEEVVRAVAIAPLPAAPPITEGVIDIRGRIVPVLDVRRRFGQAARAVDPDDHFVVARAGSRTVALRADGPTALARVSPQDLREADVTSTHVAGFVVLPDGLAVISDLARFLSAAEAQALDAALNAPAGDGTP